MKSLLCFLTALLLCTCTWIYSQESVGIGTLTPNTKAILDVESTTKGFLFPRMNTIQREAMPLTGPDVGMMVYDHDLDAPMYWNGTGWRHVGYTANVWKLSGDHVYYLDGNIGIGLTNPSSKLHVDNGETGRTAYFRNSYDGSISKYGLYNLIDSSGTGTKYGYYGVTYPHKNDQSYIYGVRHYMYSNNSSANLYGLYSYIQSGGSGEHFALRAEAPGSGNYAVWAKNIDAAGWAGFFDGRGHFSGRLGIGTITPQYQVDITTTEQRALNITNSNTASTATYGIRAQINDGASSGARYGVLADVNLATDHASPAYGFYTSVESDGTGTHYGLYASAYGSGNYGVYSSNSHADGWAGYFYGRGYFYGNIVVNNKIELQPSGFQSAGQIIVKDNDGTETIRIRGNDGTSEGSEIKMYNDAGVETIQIDAEFGAGQPSRIQVGELQITAGSDVAEYFMINDDANIGAEAGMLVSIDPNHPGELLVSNEPYDKKVAGVISGAKGIRTGLMLGQEESVADGDYPVAIAGRVYVLATTSNGPIAPGDLLTSSEQPGVAMKATDSHRAHGAVIGKAMTDLVEETGFVLVLISLQ